MAWQTPDGMRVTERLAKKAAEFRVPEIRELEDLMRVVSRSPEAVR